MMIETNQVIENKSSKAISPNSQKFDIKTSLSTIEEIKEKNVNDSCKMETFATSSNLITENNANKKLENKRAKNKVKIKCLNLNETNNKRNTYNLSFKLEGQDHININSNNSRANKSQSKISRKSNIYHLN